MSIRARVHHLLNGIVLLSFLLAPLQPLTQPSWPPDEQTPALDSPVLPSASERAPAPPLFRTRVAVHNPSDWARLEKLGVVVLERTAEERTTDFQDDADQEGAQSASSWQSAVVLADADQLEALARLRFEPQSTDELGALVTAHAQAKPWLVAGVRRLERGWLGLADQPSGAGQPIRASERSVLSALAALTSVDDDGDGLTNTEELWWCTDPLNPDSDEGGAGTTDGDEVQALRDWLANRRSSPPSTGKPFVGWPSIIAGCPDDDLDDVPDLAERWELGLNMKPWLNMNNPSTDRDRYSDGMELFGLDSTGPMSPIVRPPGNHPLVAAYPVIHVDAVPGSFRVETVTELHLDQTVITGTAKTYGTSETRGVSDSVADTVAWNEWDEVAVSTPQTGQALTTMDIPEFSLQASNSTQSTAAAIPVVVAVASVLGAATGIPQGMESNVNLTDRFCQNREKFLPCRFHYWLWGKPRDTQIVVQPPQVNVVVQNTVQNTVQTANCQGVSPDLPGCTTSAGGAQQPNAQQYISGQSPNESNGDLIPSMSGTRYAINQSGHLMAQPLFYGAYPAYSPVPVETRTHGRSWGGAHTTTHTEYQEHTISQSEQFSTQTGWTSGWAKKTDHSANLTFSYRIENVGTDYARSLSNLIFNVYIGRDPHPAFTCQMNNPPDGRNCSLVSLDNVIPGKVHEYTTAPIWLSFEQMEALDLGGPIYVVVDSYSLGDDDVFFQNARQGGVTVIMDDGVADGDESLDIYVLPTWEGDTILDVLARYFPTRKDAEGNLLAISTPEFDTTPPTWIERPLTDASWFNLYLDNLGDGSTPFRDTPARPNSTLLMRYQTDSDRDGYSDRSELRLGTDPNDPASHPSPGLVAGLNTIREGDVVTSRLAFLNTGNYDAYGVEAIMYAPDRTVRIGNNTIGGGGRVKAASQVVLGSRVLPPGLANWRTSSARPYSTGSYTGNTDKVFTFTAKSFGAVGSTQPITLTWASGTATGTLTIPAGYQSPLPLDVTAGVQVGFYSGSIIATDSFTVGVQLPRDTFTYTVESEPYTPPGVVVSYNDPQGNHRFISSVELADLSTDLAPYAGQMLAPLSLEIATTVPFTSTGTNTTNYVFNLPDSRPIEDGHLFVEYVKDDGTVVAEQVFTQTLQPGPNIIPVIWDTGIFTETYQTDHDYNILALVTDWQGNIIQSLARPLSSFQKDPKPIFAMSDADAAWDFGTATQGEVLSRTVTLANTGFLNLYTYLSIPTETITSTGTPTRASRRTTGATLTDTTTPTVDGPTEMFGDGRDGDLTVTDTVDLNPVRASASGAAGSNILTISGVTGSGFQADQLVLIHQSRGTGVGEWEFNHVESVSAGQLTLRKPLQNTYVTDSGASRAQVLWVPQYRNVAIEAGATVSPAAWNGSVGGVVVFMCNGTTTIDGTITARGRGYRGGARNTLEDTYAWQGEGTASGGSQTTAANGTGGGGAHKSSAINSWEAGSGGGGNGTSGGSGGNSGSSIGGAGGGTAGNLELTTMVFGGGSGGGRNRDGQAGAGIITVVSRKINVTGTIVADGTNGVPWVPSTSAIGGSAGGSALLKGQEITLGTSLVSAQGGTGAAGNQFGGASGSGGDGRIRIEYCDTLSGSTNPPASVQQITCSPTVTPTPPPPLTLVGPISRRLAPSDTTTYTVTLDTRDLPAGPYDETITVRTSDPANPTRTVQVAGNIQALSEAAYARHVMGRPLDLEVWIPGDYDAHEWVEFTHTLGPDPQSLHPVKVYSRDYGTLWGMGKYASAFGSGMASYDMFGDGRDGSLTVSSGQTVYVDNVRTQLTSTASAGQKNLSVALTSGFQVGDEVLVIQMQGTEAGRYEFGTTGSIGSGVLTLQDNLQNTYEVGGNSKAQVLRVPHYHNVTVESGGILGAHAWDGNTGGIIVFRAYDAFTVAGSVVLDGKGFRGGVGDYGNNNQWGYQEAQSGEGTLGPSRYNRNYANGNGGGGGLRENSDVKSCGGGGGNGRKASHGWCGKSGEGGNPAGTADLRMIVLGGGGGAGNPDWPGGDGPGGSGGKGGGILIAVAKQTTVTGSITANGTNGTGGRSGQNNAGGGGGAGGSVLIQTAQADLRNTLVTALGGAGGVGGAGAGGDGAVGRIRIEYCDTFTGTTNPEASVQRLDCYVVEQIESDPYDRGRLNLPESFTSGRTYRVQYGRRLVFDSAGEQVATLRVPGGTLAHVTLDALISSTSSGDLTFKLDVGNDGTWDWQTTRTITSAVTLSSPELAAAFTQHTAGQTGEVDVPVKVYMSQSGQVLLTNLTATPASDVDVTVGTGDIGFGNGLLSADSGSGLNGLMDDGPNPLNPFPQSVDSAPTEGEVITVTATLHNTGAADSGPLTVAFFATPSGGLGETYIGADFVSNVPAGGTAPAGILWDTLGFAGDVPVRVVMDPFDRLAETDEDNNEATTNITILTRPDLRISNLQFSNLEPVAGQPVTVSVTISNAGQTDAGNSTLALYACPEPCRRDGNPDSGGTLVGQGTPAVAGESETVVTFTWTPAAPGPHRLFAVSDRDNVVSEFDEGNNQTWRDVYVGFKGPILLDSGNPAADPVYTTTLGYGVVDEGAADALESCGSESHETFRRDSSNQVIYRFDHLLPGHFYHLDVTLYNCPLQPPRREAVLVDGISIAGPVDLRDDGEVHHLSTLLDPALYANRAISVTIESSGSGAVVSEVNLHDIDYRYVDAGSTNDLSYTLERGYGYLDETSTSQTDHGTLPYQSYRQDQADQDLHYQFDGLDPAKRYLVHLTFYQNSPFTALQRILIDNVDTGLSLEVVPGQILTPTIQVPWGTYQSDGRIAVRVVRTTVGAFVNEIALEELTLGTAAEPGPETQTIELHAGWNWISFALEPKIERDTACTGVTPTSAFSIFTGDVLIDGQPAPVGTLVEAYSPRGDKVGCQEVSTAGFYPFLRVYGEEGSLPGMKPNEPIIFKVNGVPATPTSGSVIWQNDKDTHMVNLEASGLPPVEKVLAPVSNVLEKLLCEVGTYLPLPANPIFNTCHTMQPALGYLLRAGGDATLTIEGERGPVDTSLSLHQGWNWIGYLPSCSLSIETALSSIDGQFDLLHGETGSFRPPAGNPSNTLHQMGPGRGYMIRMTAPATLKYPPSACGATAQTSEVSRTSEVLASTCAATPTPFFTVFYGTALLGDRPYPAGTPIQALSPRGEVVGCGQVGENGQYPFLRVFGADEDIPGMQAGDPVTFRVNGRLVELEKPALWQNDRDVHRLDLRVEPAWGFLPLVVR